jgi:ribosomal protein S6--L-glutamate ligase
MPAIKEYYMPCRKAVALGARLKPCRNVLTLGVRPNFSDYTSEEADMIRKAGTIFYPSSFYADLFDSMGKKTFPSYHTYKYVQDKIKQTAIFNLFKLPHPKTHVFYGRRQKQKILDMFSFPFIAKIPRGSTMGRGVFLIRNEKELSAYTNVTHAAYIQEYFPIDRDIRVVVIGNKVICAYWRVSKSGEYRSNINKGAAVSLDPVPQPAIDLALRTAQLCRWDDVGIDICCFEGQYFLFEANMKYGKQGFKAAGIDYFGLMEQLIDNGEI